MTQMFAVFISTFVHTQKADDTFKVGCVYLQWENASKRRNKMLFVHFCTSVQPLFCVYIQYVSDLFLRSKRVVRMSADMSLSNVHWDMALCLLIAWIMCYFCVWKGIRSTGKASTPIGCIYSTITYILGCIPFMHWFPIRTEKSLECNFNAC